MQAGSSGPGGREARMAKTGAVREAGRTACGACPRAGARGGARACGAGCVRIFSMTGASRIAAMIFNSPRQLGQCSRSISETRLSSRAKLID